MIRTHFFFFMNKLFANINFFSSTGLLVPLFLPSLGPLRLNSFFLSPFISYFTNSNSVDSTSKLASVLFTSILLLFP